MFMFVLNILRHNLLGDLLGTNRPEGWVRTDRKWVRNVWAWVWIVWVRKIHGYETTGYHKTSHPKISMLILLTVSVSAIHFIVLLAFYIFLELSRTSSLFPGFAGPAAWTVFNNYQPCCIEQIKSRSTRHCDWPGPCDERLLRIGKVLVTASQVRNTRGKKSISSKLG